MNPGGEQLQGQLQLVATIGAVVLFLIILDLVRRRRLFERYAILWLFTALALVGLALWRGGLDLVSNLLGVAYPPTALFVIALGFVIILLLHFSVAVSRLSDQSKVLAQRLALLEERLREASRQQESEPARPKPVPVASDSPAEGEHASPEPVPVARSAAGRRPPAS